MLPPPSLPPLLRALAQACRARGGQAVLVGGAVRDLLRGQPVKDWDVEVFGIPLDALEALLRRHGQVNTVGKSFGVFKLSQPGSPQGAVDVSIPRRDSKVGPGHTGIAIEGDPTMSHAEAARRRDLTINAMMLDLVDGTLIDPHGGAEDLRAGVLRAVDTGTFLEDPLRAVRVVQFAGRFGFSVDPATLALCRVAALDELPPERIQEEWRKLMLRSPAPSVGLVVAREARLLERLFPEAAATLDPGDAVDAAAGQEPPEPEGRHLALMLGAWLHRTTPSAVEATLDRLWLHKWGGYALRRELLRALPLIARTPDSDAELRHQSVEAELELTLRLRQACMGDGPERLRRARKLGIARQPPKRILLGRHVRALGVPDGPRMGEVLQHVYELQLDGTVRHLDGARAEAIAWLSSSGGR